MLPEYRNQCLRNLVCTWGHLNGVLHYSVSSVIPTLQPPKLYSCYVLGASHTDMRWARRIEECPLDEVQPAYTNQVFKMWYPAQQHVWAPSSYLPLPHRRNILHTVWYGDTDQSVSQQGAATGLVSRRSRNRPFSHTSRARWSAGCTERAHSLCCPYWCNLKMILIRQDPEHSPFTEKRYQH